MNFDLSFRWAFTYSLFVHRHVASLCMLYSEVRHIDTMQPTTKYHIIINVIKLTFSAVFMNFRRICNLEMTADSPF